MREHVLRENYIFYVMICFAQRGSGFKNKLSSNSILFRRASLLSLSSTSGQKAGASCSSVSAFLEKLFNYFRILHIIRVGAKLFIFVVKERK